MCICGPVENFLDLGTLEEAGALIGSLLFEKFFLNRATSLLSYSYTTRLKEKGVIMFGALKNVKITRIVESRAVQREVCQSWRCLVPARAVEPVGCLPS